MRIEMLQGLFGSHALGKSFGGAGAGADDFTVDWDSRRQHRKSTTTQR